MPLLVDRAAIVTGASAGLGAGIARELAARGARVLICSRAQDRIDAAAERITTYLRQQGPAAGADTWHRPCAITADLTEPTAGRRLAEAAQENFGHLDVLVCNCGGPPPGDFADFDDRAWTEAFQLVVLSVIRTIGSCLPLLRQSGSGRIIILGSISGLKPVRQLVLSNVLRPALMGLSRHLAGELAADRILVNTVAPGFFDTERSREVLSAVAEKLGRPLATVSNDLASRVPLKRQGRPEELGRLVAFLASEENSYLTGQTLVADGGLLQSD
jgi:3-oxoacyl-[acyl-carrier protein] reductase